VIRRLAHHHHLVQLLRVGGVVGLEDLDLERACRHLVEDGLRVEGAVVVADAGMVAADDEVGRAHVLAEVGVQHGLARAGVEHVEAVAGDHGAVRREVQLDHLADAGVAHRAGMSPGLSLPSSMWMTRPSHSRRSMAMWQSSSWARCIGLRVWKATTRFQPRSAISLRISTAVRKVSGKSSEVGEVQHLDRPGQCGTALGVERRTPGCSVSRVP
jgi:hypothetical protein